MQARVLDPEFVATERLNVIAESIDGLRWLKDNRGINPTQAAALAALESLYRLGIRTRGAGLNHKAMARPVWIAQKAMEGMPCAR